MLARGFTTQTIKQRCQLLERFQEFTGEFPWQWRPVDIEDFLTGLRSGEKPISLKTLRSYSNAVAMFCAGTKSPIRAEWEVSTVRSDAPQRVSPQTPTGSR